MQLQDLVAGGIITALVASGTYDLAQRNIEKWRFDNETPLVETFAVNPQMTTVRPGDTVTLHYAYRRRPGCVGTVDYRMTGTPTGWDHPASFVVGQYRAGWKEGTATNVAQFVLRRDFKPGKYTFTFTTRAAKCKAVDGFKASSEPIEHPSLPVSITVLPPPEIAVQ